MGSFDLSLPSRGCFGDFETQAAGATCVSLCDLSLFHVRLQALTDMTLVQYSVTFVLIPLVLGSNLAAVFNQLRLGGRS